MIRYFFKLALRNIQKYKVSTFISLLGLTVGLASFILISTYIKHELSFNKNNKHYKRIFLSKVDHQVGDGTETGSGIPYYLVEQMISDYPEVENGVRISRAFISVKYENFSFFENTGYYTENSFFDIFTVKFLKGDTKNPLAEPYTVVLTKSFAEKYFGDVDPIGKSLLIDERFTVKVTAIIEDMPVNTDFKYDFYISFGTYLAINPGADRMDSNAHWFRTFFLLDKNCNIDELNKKTSGLFDEQYPERLRVFYLSPLSDYHLKSNNSDLVKILIIFGAVAIFILIIACINFINLSIANAANRVKETSIRRIVGSSKISLITQQVGESVFLSFISFDLAYLLAERLLPRFNAILQTQIPSNVILNVPFILSMFATAIMLGLVSGIFPAVKIGKIQPLNEISRRQTKISKVGIAKKGLIVFQYSVSIVLIIASLIMSQQFDYIKNRDLGFESGHIITNYVHKLDNSSNPELKTFRDEMLNQAGVKNITLHTTLPFISNSTTVIRKETAPKEEEFIVNKMITDLSFLGTYSIDLITKNEFSLSKSDGDMGYCYVNETAVKKLGFKDPLGEIVILNDTEDKYRIVGVCKDYHFTNLQSIIEPMILILKDRENIDSYDIYYWMSIKCNAHSISEVIEIANTKLKEHLPDNPYDFFNFGDTEFKTELLNKLNGIEKTFGFFTIIAILIACMGIFGLVALTVKQKTKEIGIRKALGSTVFGIYKLIAREYLLLAIAGNVIAWVPAWFIINKILQDFAYRIDINLGVFVVGFISSIILTIITIAFHTIKAARTNPVEALRYE